MKPETSKSGSGLMSREHKEANEGIESVRKESSGNLADSDQVQSARSDVPLPLSKNLWVEDEVVSEMDS